MVAKTFASFTGNELQYIALFAVSGSIKKLSSIDYVNIYLFSIFSQYVFLGGNVWGYPILLVT